MIGQKELEVMDQQAWLVNVARGALVDTAALVGALRSNQIGGAALDVTDPEPLPAGHPLWDLPNCLITPHTVDTEQLTEPLLAARIAENVRRLAAGLELEGRVDPDLGYLARDPVNRSSEKRSWSTGRCLTTQITARELSRGGPPGAFWRDGRAARPWPGRLRSCSRPGLACNSGSPPRGRLAA